MTPEQVAQVLLKVDTTGFSFDIEVEEQEDNRKFYQYIESPDGKRHWLDHTPYRRLTQEDFEKYVAFYKAHGRMPNREDINSCGPLRSENMNFED